MSQPSQGCECAMQGYLDPYHDPDCNKHVPYFQAQRESGRAPLHIRRGTYIPPPDSPYPEPQGAPSFPRTRPREGTPSRRRRQAEQLSGRARNVYLSDDQIQSVPIGPNQQPFGEGTHLLNKTREGTLETLPWTWDATLELAARSPGNAEVAAKPSEMISRPGTSHNPQSWTMSTGPRQIIQGSLRSEMFHANTQSQAVEAARATVMSVIYPENGGHAQQLDGFIPLGVGSQARSIGEQPQGGSKIDRPSQYDPSFEELCADSEGSDGGKNSREPSPRGDQR